MSDTQTEIDLKAFCGGPFSKPFVRNGKRYATDGFICVRVDAAGEPNVEYGIDAAEDVMPKGDIRWEPWPEPAYVSRFGLCEQCNGNGDMRCPTCGGNGRCVQPHHQVIAGKKIRAKHDRLIRALPGVMYSPDSPSGESRALWFRFDGGDGAVMPLT